MKWKKYIALVGMSMIVVALAPSVAAHSAANHQINTFYMENLNGQVNDVKDSCTKHEVTSSGGDVEAPYTLKDGPDYRVHDDFMDSEDYRWKTEVDMEINNGNSHWTTETMYVDYDTNAVVTDTHRAEAISGCSLYSVQIEGTSIEQKWTGSSWGNTGDSRIIDSDSRTGIDIYSI